MTIKKVGAFLTGLVALAVAATANAGEHRLKDVDFVDDGTHWTKVADITENYTGTITNAMILYNSFREAKGEKAWDYYSEMDKFKEAMFDEINCESPRGCDYILKEDVFSESFLSGIDVDPKNHDIMLNEVNQYREDHGLKPFSYE